MAFDYHVDVDRHYYSVPHALVGHTVWVRFTAATVEVLFRSQRVTSHVRSYQRGTHTTLSEHMPKSHRAHAEWSPKRLIQWGESIGANTGAIVEHLLRSKPHPDRDIGLVSGSWHSVASTASRAWRQRVRWPCGWAAQPARASSQSWRAAGIYGHRTSPNPWPWSSPRTAMSAARATTTDLSF